MEFDCDTVLLSVGLIPENELSRQAGIEIDPRTNGPVVYENMETSIPGVFASGNVVHVHDLVDYVTLESGRAGEAAARFAQGKKIGGDVLAVNAAGDIGYTVPQKIRMENVEKNVGIFFRVRRNFDKSVVTVKSGDEQIARYTREFMVPGEMQNITIPKVLLEKAKGSITISAEEAE